ncbi:MAG TPA: Gfo/Idh/MocA family oxidoreductase [Gillisia sp.]|nr:Gfo/Idh/MocA family oxidoreductase [Gillisia sp.]
MEEKMEIRAGIIGSGFSAGFHIDAIRRVYGTRVHIAGVFSRNLRNSQHFAEKHGIPSFPDLEMLIETCDVLHLCTPPVTHESLALIILAKGKHVIIEKPLTGYFGNEAGLNGDTFPREEGLKKAMESIERILVAEETSTGSIFYAENWIYAPAIQKEREVVEKTRAQILWIQAQQSHSGSHSAAYGKWHLSGGGSLMGKGCHPISAVLYLKQVEGISRNGKPIRPLTVTCRTHSITRMDTFDDKSHIRASYTDVEDYGFTHIVFEDGTIADITASELLQGGVKNYLEVHANNHRTICNITPNNAMQTYNPVEENFEDIYVVEKTGTKMGWSNISPDEAWFNGYQQEIQAFYLNVAIGGRIESNSRLAADTIAVIYSSYLSSQGKGVEVKIPLK